MEYAKPTDHSVDNSSQHADAQELTNDPAHVDKCGENRSKAHGCNVSSIRGYRGLESSPRNSAKKIACQQHWSVLCKEHQEDEEYSKDLSANDGLDIAETIDEESSEKKSDKLASSSSILEARLPVRGHLILSGATVDRDTELPVEWTETIEVPIECGIIALHDDAKGHESGEEYSLGVFSKGLKYSHVLLSMCFQEGIVNCLIVHPDSGAQKLLCLDVLLR